MLFTPPPLWKISASFTPADLTGLIAWYDATVDVYNDAGSTLATNGQEVVQWNDQSGNGYHLGKGATGPTYQTTGFNSLPTISFDASVPNKMLASSVSVGGTVLSCFAVGQMLTGTESFGRILSYIDALGGGADFDNDGSAAMLLRDSGNNGIAAYRNGALDAAAISLATNYRLGSVFDGTNHNTYVNNVATGPTANSMSFGASGGLEVGDASGGSWSGPISEIVVFASAPDGATRTSLDDYFKTKWSL
jgi:hypothetical protein